MGGATMALNLSAATKLAKTLSLIRRDVPKHARKAFAQYVTNDMKRALIAGVDPYGSPHRPLSPITVERKGHGMILYHSGRLLRGMRAVVRGANTLIRDATKYGSYHISGAGVPVRAWAPINGIPKHWREELKKIVAASIKYVGGKR